MRAKWCAPEYATLFEVADATGARQSRSADALIMSLWPSRGLELHGVEIKVSRSDYRREAADPTKAETIAAFCDRWWLHVAPNVITDLSDVPPAWGVREWDGRIWRTIREAEKTEAKPPNRAFLASLLRRNDEAVTRWAHSALEKEREGFCAQMERERAQVADRVQCLVQQRTAAFEALADKVAKFEAAAGLTLSEWGDWGKIGAAARALADCRDGWGSLAARLRKAADEIDAISAMAEAPADGGRA